jgi:hypothetical protein
MWYLCASESCPVKWRLIIANAWIVDKSLENNVVVDMMRFKFFFSLPFYYRTLWLIFSLFFNVVCAWSGGGNFLKIYIWENLKFQYFKQIFIKIFFKKFECPCPFPFYSLWTYIFINKKSMLESKANEDELLMSKKRRAEENSFLSTLETLLRSLDDERLNYLIVLLHWMLLLLFRVCVPSLEQKRGELMTFYGPLSLTSYFALYFFYNVSTCKFNSLTHTRLIWSSFRTGEKNANFFFFCALWAKPTMR